MNKLEKGVEVGGTEDQEFELKLEESQGSLTIPVTQKYGLKENILADLKCKVPGNMSDSSDDSLDVNDVKMEIKTGNKTEELKENEMDIDENEIDTLVKDIEDGTKKISQLVKEVKLLEKDVKEAREEYIIKENRIRTKKTEKEALEDVKQEQEKKLVAGKEWEKETRIDMKKIQNYIKTLEIEMTKMELNGVRLLGGGERGFKFKTLEILEASGKRVSVFFPGAKAWDDQPKAIKEDAIKVTKLEVNSYGKTLVEAAASIKEYNPKEDKEVEVGMILLTWGKLAEVKEAVANVELIKVMGMIRVVMNRGKSKFNRMIICIPPQAKGNKRAMEKLVSEIKSKYDKATENIHVIQEEEKLEASTAEALDDPSDELDPAFFRFCLSAMAKLISGEIYVDICSRCRLIHDGKDDCGLDEDDQSSGSGE